MVADSNSACLPLCQHECWQVCIAVLFAITKSVVFSIAGATGCGKMGISANLWEGFALLFLLPE